MTRGDDPEAGVEAAPLREEVRPEPSDARDPERRRRGGAPPRAASTRRRRASPGRGSALCFRVTVGMSTGSSRPWMRRCGTKPVARWKSEAPARTASAEHLASARPPPRRPAGRSGPSSSSSIERRRPRRPRTGPAPPSGVPFRGPWRRPAASARSSRRGTIRGSTRARAPHRVDQLDLKVGPRLRLLERLEKRPGRARIPQLSERRGRRDGDLAARRAPTRSFGSTSGGPCPFWPRSSIARARTQ